MELEIVRRIRGNVHGTIDITGIEDRIIDHPQVQRLRRIRQLAFLSFVFPGASHTRFEHSLGVMQLAGITWQKMRANQRRLAQTCNKYNDFADRERTGVGGLVHGLLAPTFSVMDDIFGSAYTQQVLRLAGLLHDVGHPPFSHSGERFMPTWTQVLHANRHSPDYLTDYLQSRCDALSQRGEDPSRKAVRHEVFTFLMVDRILSEVFDQDRSGMRIIPRDVIAVLCPDIEPDKGSALNTHKVYRLCHELISGEVDIDRMDYLLRDSRECGVVYGIFDATRIQDSLTLYHDPLDNGIHLAISYSGLAAFEDYLRARLSMYLQLYFHKTSVACEAMMQHLSKLLGGWTLPADLEHYAKIDEYNIEALLSRAGESLQGEVRARFMDTLDALLMSRRLWKRVYEVSARDREEGQPAMDSATGLIREMGIPYEMVSSKSSLTSFRPRRGNEVSRNYLRLIKKDEYQFPRVYPIEDYTQLVEADTRVHISRVYVEDRRDAQGVSQPARIRQALIEKLRTET